jgi:hypothetical protein
VDAGERGDEVVGPGPVGGEAAAASSCGGAEVAGGVQQAVAEPFRLGRGEVAVEGEESGPGQQVVGAEGEVEPGVVDRERVRWQVGQAGGFGVADLSFGAATAAVERFE